MGGELFCASSGFSEVLSLGASFTVGLLQQAFDFQLNWLTATIDGKDVLYIGSLLCLVVTSMQFGRVLVAFAFGLNALLSTGVDAKDAAAQVQPSSAPRRSGLIANCPDSVYDASPLAPRPVISRATFAAKPVARARRRATIAHRPHHPKAHRPSHRIRPAVGHKRTVAHRRLVKAHHPAARKPHALHARRPAVHRAGVAARRGRLHRVTYASPLCGERSQGIDDLLGLENIASPETQTAVENSPNDVQNVVFTPYVPGVTGGGSPGPVIVLPGSPVSPGGPTFPGGPTIPGGPGTPGGPVIVVPPVTPPDTPIPPVGPPTPPLVTPPTTPAVPEPATWATMILGMALVGLAMRRKRPSREPGRTA